MSLADPVASGNPCAPGPRAVDAGGIEAALERAVSSPPELARRGRVQEAVGVMVKASGVDVKVGETCHLVSPSGESVLGEVVGFSKGVSLMVPFSGMPGISSATAVVPTGRMHEIAVGQGLLGRVLDGFGLPIDGKGELRAVRSVSVHAPPPDPLKRRLIERALPTGVRAIDGLLTVGEGQRVGIMAPAGAGKSTLLGMLARGAEADVNVIALIGERGREVREFIDLCLGPSGLEKSVLVVSTSDKTAIERTRAAHVATAIAEYYRDQGQSVLLMMDSVTRFARGQRELGLASGEPPTRRGFPPSLFAELPRLLERAGQGEQGSITAFYTVLVEDEQMSDPVAEEVRSILDGHIVLSPKLAARGTYPAIDVLSSVSRVMSAIVPAQHLADAAGMRKLMGKLNDIELLVQVGEYKAGSDRLADEALRCADAISTFLGQGVDEFSPFAATVGRVARIARP